MAFAALCRQGVNTMPDEEEPEERYEDAPFGMFVRFGGGRGGLWFRYKGHVSAAIRARC